MVRERRENVDDKRKKGEQNGVIFIDIFVLSE
jgi:hypothetical protein